MVPAIQAMVESGDLDKAGLALKQSLDAQAPNLGEVIWLRALIFHHHEPLRQQAVRGLGLAQDTESTGVLLELLSRGMSFTDHDFVYQAFRDMGGSAVPRLAEHLADSSSQWGAIQCLGIIGGEAVPHLISAAQRGLEGALRAIENTHDARAVPALLELWNDDDNEDLAFALASCCDSSCKFAVPFILGKLKKDPGNYGLIDALVEICDARAISAFTRALRLDDTFRSACRGLIRLESRGSAEILVQAARSSRTAPNKLPTILDAVIRHPASNVDERLEAARTILARFTQDSQMDHCMKTLAEHSDCTQILLDIAGTDDPLGRLALALSGSRCCGDPLLHFDFAKRFGSVAVRVRCAESASLIPEMTPALLGAMAIDPEPAVRWALAEDLYLFKNMPSVIETLAVDPTVKVRAQAAGFVYLCADPMPLLTRLILDRSQKVRLRVASSLSMLQGKVDEELRVRLLGRFLHDQRGRAVDPIIGDWGEKQFRDYRVSDALAESPSTTARKLLRRWRRAYRVANRP